LTVAVYVPGGVPGVVVEDDEPPPPQAATAMKAKTIMGTARADSRRRLPTNNRPEASRTSVHPTSLEPGGKLAEDKEPAVPGAVVVTVTVTGVAAPPVTLTEPGKVQLGAGVTAGAMLQVRFTVPLNDPAGVRDKLNVAVFPAGMVDELDDPDARLIVKSGTAVPVPDTATCCEPVPALSCRLRRIAVS
jgi:hypothetical protein